MKNDQSSTGKDLKDEVASGAKSMAENVGNIAEAAGEKLEEYKESAKEIMNEMNNTSLADIEKTVTTGIRNSPGRSLLGAAAVGFVLGILFCRR